MHRIALQSDSFEKATHPLGSSFRRDECLKAILSLQRLKALGETGRQQSGKGPHLAALWFEEGQGVIFGVDPNPARVDIADAAASSHRKGNAPLKPRLLLGQVPVDEFDCSIGELQLLGGGRLLNAHSIARITFGHPAADGVAHEDSQHLQVLERRRVLGDLFPSVLSTPGDEIEGVLKGQLGRDRHAAVAEIGIEPEPRFQVAGKRCSFDMSLEELLHPTGPAIRRLRSIFIQFLGRCAINLTARFLGFEWIVDAILGGLGHPIAFRVFLFNPPVGRIFSLKQRGHKGNRTMRTKSANTNSDNSRQITLSKDEAPEDLPRVESRWDYFAEVNVPKTYQTECFSSARRAIAGLLTSVGGAS